MLTTLFKVSVIAVILRLGSTNFLRQAREQHSGHISSNNDLRVLSTLGDSDYINKVLDNILIPRVVGTEGHEKVFKYIQRELKLLNWHVTVDEFMEKTPIFGNLKFRNIIATLNPQAERFLVLSAHYDTKYFKNEVFVGAIDSAVPVAMMLEIAKTMTKALKAKDNMNVGLKFIFFDGEEAFQRWGPKDSLYGSRHLAKKLYNNQSVMYGETINELDKFDALVLLDLIGAKNPSFMDYFESTHRWFVRLAQVEYELHEMGLLKNHKYNYFQLQKPYRAVEDDHLPFLARNVPILHIITDPFPPEWHTPKDNRDVIDMDTVMNINMILKVFISEYLHLSLNEPGVSSENPIPIIIVFLFAVTFFIYKNFVQ